MHAVAEGLSYQAAARVFQVPENSVRSWITGAGQHSKSLHAKNVSPVKAQALIRAAAKRALRRLPEMSPLVVSTPVRLEVAFFRPKSA